MGEIILISGAAKSGKTQLAEEMALASSAKRLCYIATQANQHTDKEMERRILAHQAKRSPRFETVERFNDLPDWIASQSYDGYLLDCVTLWLTNLFFAYLEKQGIATEDFDQKIANLKAEEISAISDYFQQEVVDLLLAAQKTSASLWLVTNETGWGVTPPSQLGRLFVDFYGQVNQQLAAASDEVYLAIMGLKKQVKPWLKF